MRKLFPFIFFALLFGCSPEGTLTETESPNLAVDAREELDCNDFCLLEDNSSCLPDFSFCSELAGKRPFKIVFGTPPLAVTGQKEGEQLPFTVGFCEPPVAHPWIFSVTGGFVGPNIVEVSRYMGKLQSVTFDVCLRPYIDPSFDPFPFPEPFPYDEYPAGNELSGTWELVAANGDILQLFLEGSGAPKCDNPIEYFIDGYWMVSGGTGRFADATGGGCLSGSGPSNFFDPNPPVDAPWTLEGGIDF